MFALHYVFIPIINKAVAEFVEPYNRHDLHTEHRMTPLMIWTNGIISSSHARNTAVQDFANGKIDLVGVDPEGPECNDVQIPITEVNLSEEGLPQLHLEDPLHGVPTMELIYIFEFVI